jgi:hypothetical protein
VTWTMEQPGPHITVGILDVYVYAASTHLCTATDPRVGYAEWCDGAVPSPACVQMAYPTLFGCVGFGGAHGYLPTEQCQIAVGQTTWGKVKALYR